MAAINFDITADGHQVKQEVSSVTRSIGAMAKEAEGAGVSMKEMFKQAALFSGAALGVAGVREFASQVMNVRKEMQSFQISFDTLLGSRQKGQEMLGELKQFAATTPLMLKDLAAGAQTMLGFNLEAERVVPTLKAIGDISMGDAQKFQSLTLAFSQMSATGKLTGQDLIQMINAGFSPLAEISRKTGKSIAELKEEMSNGAISAEMVADAFMSATSEGGKFFGMLEKQGQGLAGQMNQLQGAIQDMFAEIGEQAEDVIVAGIQGVTDLVHNYEQVGRIIASIVAVYGSYRAAVMAVTVVQQLETAGALAAAGAHGAQAVAIGVATKAAAAFNATLLANPFVAVTVLMTAFAASIWRTSHELTAAEKGSRAYNESLKEWRQNEQQLNSVMSENLAMLEDVNESDYKRQQALDALKERYPSLFRDYDIETIKLADIAKLKREIAELDENRNSAKISGDIDDLDAEIKRYEAMIRTMGAGDEGYIKKLEELKEARKEAMREYSKVAGADYAKGLANVDDATLDKYVAELERRIRGKARDAEIELRLPGVDGKLGRQALFSVRDVQGIIDMTKARKQTGSGSETKDPYQQQARKAYADWERAKKEYDRIVKDSKSTKEEVDKAYAEMERLDKAYADLTHGDKASAVSKAGSKRLTEQERINEQLTELEEKQARERQRAEKDRELAIEQAAIDALKEGGEKKRRQIALDYERQIETIEREKQDLIRAREEEARELWEAQNAGRKDGATWQSSGAQAQYRASAVLTGDDEDLFSARLKAAQAAYDRGISELLEDEEQHMREYLEQYGTYEQKRLAIAEDYAKRIADAQTKGQKMSLQRQMEEALSELDMTAFRDSINWEVLFNDLDKISLERLKALKDRLRDVLSGDVSPENAQVISEQISRINDQIAAKQKEWLSAFGLVIPQLERMRQLKSEEAEAQDDLNRAQERQMDILGKIARIRAEIAMLAKREGVDLGDVGITSGNSDALLGLFGKAGKDTSGLTDMLSDLGDSEAQLGNSTQKLSSAMAKADAAAEAAGGSFAGTAAVIDSIVHGINDNVQSANALFEQMGIAETKFGRGFDNFAQSSQYATDAWESLKSGNIMGVANGIYGSLRTLGDALGEWGVGGFGSSDTTLLDDIEKLTASNEALRYSIDELADKMSEGAVADAAETFRQMAGELEESERNTREMMQRSASAYSNGFLGIGGDSSSAYEVNKGMSGSEWDRISNLLGKSVRHAGEFFALTSEEMYRVATELPDIYAHIKDLANDGYKDASQFMDEYIAYYQQLESLQEAYMEKLTSVSFDTIQSDFANALMDMDSEAEDFADNFEMYMQQAIINAMVSEQYKPMIEKWYKAFSSYMTDGLISEAEMRRLREEGGTYYDELTGKEETFVGWDDMAKSAIEARDALKDMFAWEDSYRQEATTKGFQTMSQSTAEALEGRFTALQIGQQTLITQGVQLIDHGATTNRHLETIAELAATRNGILNDIYARMASMSNRMSDALTQIADNTRNI